MFNTVNRFSGKQEFLIEHVFKYDLNIYLLNINDVFIILQAKLGFGFVRRS